MRTEVAAPQFEPPYLHPDYRATVLRAPGQRLVRLPEEWFHRTAGPAFGRIPVSPSDADLTRQHQGEPLGERIFVSGRIILVTQMYFPGDPLIPLDPILRSVGDRGRDLLVARFDLETTRPEWALGYRWDIVLRGRAATPREV